MNRPDPHPEADSPRDRRVAGLLTIIDRHRHVSEQRIQLNSADIRLLWLFSDGRARTLREISDTLGLEQSTVNRQVNAALTAGLVERHREPGRSAWLLEATDHGRALFEQDIADALGAYDRALDSLGDDAERFVDLLDRFTIAYGDAVDALPQRHADPR